MIAYPCNPNLRRLRQKEPEFGVKAATEERRRYFWPVLHALYLCKCQKASYSFSKRFGLPVWPLQNLFVGLF